MNGVGASGAGAPGTTATNRPHGSVAVVLPAFPPGLVGLLATTGQDEAPHVIPVSALHRSARDRVLMALAPGRGSLARLRARPPAALALLGTGFAVTAEGTTAVVADPLPGAGHVVAVELRVERLVDTLGTRTVIEEGIRWTWRDATSGSRHRATLAGLAALAASGTGGGAQAAG